MANKRLSKKEYKYRNKIICEYHLKKADQRKLDEYIVKYHFHTYRELYNDQWLLGDVVVNVYGARLSDALAKFGISLIEADGSFRRLTDIFSDLSDAWEGEISYGNCFST